jgi:hypothetical protein
MVNGNTLTPTHERILTALSDGLPHSIAELRGCLGDELALSVTLRVHLTNLRKILRPKGEDISFHRLAGVGYYQHVRLVGSPYKG